MSETTLFVARMMAPYLFVTALGFFLSKPFYLRMLNESETAHPVVINLSGMVHFFIGMAILLNHFRWGSVPEAVVSILGFAFVLKGALLIAVPELALKSNETTVGRLPVVAAGFLIASLYLAYVGYISP